MVVLIDVYVCLCMHLQVASALCVCIIQLKKMLSVLGVKGCHGLQGMEWVLVASWVNAFCGSFDWPFKQLTSLLCEKFNSLSQVKSTKMQSTPYSPHHSSLSVVQTHTHSLYAATTKSSGLKITLFSMPLVCFQPIVGLSIMGQDICVIGTA